MIAKYEISTNSKLIFVSYQKGHEQPQYINYVWLSFSQLSLLQTRDTLLKEFEADWPITLQNIVASGNNLLDLIIDCFQIARDELIDKGMIEEEQA